MIRAKVLALALLLFVPTVPVTDSLERYAREPIETVRSATDSQSLSALNSALRRDGVTWMLAKGAGEANRRRLIAASFALDVAGAEFDSQARAVAPLVEWGCEQIRKRLPSDAERQWHIAAMALLEGLGDLQAVEAHLAHVTPRFPDEPRWRQARTWLVDSRTLNVHPRQPVAAARVAFPAALAAQYQELTAVPELAADAWTRIGYLHFLAGAHADARAAFARAVASGSANADTRYLTHLFSAWIAERDRARDDAVRELRAALEAAPSGQTAAVWLAVTYQLAGLSADAQVTAARGLSPMDVGDPWRSFYGGDMPRWPMLIAAVRKAAQ